MGYLKFQGFKEPCWEPQKYIAWLIEHKLEKEPELNLIIYDEPFGHFEDLHVNRIYGSLWFLEAISLSAHKYPAP